MPKVGDKEFSYDSKGIKEAAKESMETGIPISNGAQRSVQTYAGGGKTGYNIPMYKEGGKTLEEYNREKVKEYEDRFKTDKQKVKERVDAKAKKRAKKGLKPMKRKKPKAKSFENMSDKEIMELMDSQQKYEKGGKVKERFTHSNFPGKSWDSEDHFYDDVIEPINKAKAKERADAKAKKDKEARDKKIKDRDKKDKEKGAKKYGPHWATIGENEEMPPGSGRE